MWLWIYRLAFLPTLLVVAPSVIWRMRRRGGYRQDFIHRFGALPIAAEKRPGVRRVWVQAVSVGEVLAVEPLLRALGEERDVEVLLTTTTSTGLALARQNYTDRVAAIGYFPLDWLPFVRRAWQRVQPDLVLLTEGERWPEHIAHAHAQGIPVICVNARVSDRSFTRMRALRFAVGPLLRGITQLLTVSPHDAARFRALGFTAEQVVVTGNLKLDLTIQHLDTAARGRLRQELGLGTAEMVLLGSSTWPGEEEALIDAWARARAAGIPCRLLIVPRHAERRDEVEDLLRAAGYRYHLRTRGPAPHEVDIAVADTTGELRQMTQLADLVFVGKSLPPHHEGQTPVEAAALRRPILFGPRMTNFRAIADELVAAGGARRVESADALARAVVELLPDPAARERLGEAAQRWQFSNQGAIARTWAQIRAHLPR